MSSKKIQFIPSHPQAPNLKKISKNCSGVSVVNLEAARVQMFYLQNLVGNHIPFLESENQKKENEIRKLKTLYKLKDDEWRNANVM